jgi:hypothetical protein
MFSTLVSRIALFSLSMSVAAILSAQTLVAQSRPTCPGSAAADNFFPQGALFPLSSDVDAFRQRWYSRNLQAMDESSLSCGLRDEDEVYRFLWLPSFQSAVAVRITRTRDGATLDMTELTGARGDEPGTVGTHQEKKLTNAEWDSLQAALAAIDFWNMPTNPPPDPNFAHADGSRWILEGHGAGTYHVIDRWSPEESPYGKACLKFIGLTKRAASSE